MADQTILIADDDAAFRAGLRAFLHRSGYQGFEFREAGDGAQALHIFEQIRRNITCVILDFDMPHMDGIEAARRMCAVDQTTPIIIFSNSRRQPDGGLAAAAGAARIFYVEKVRDAILQAVAECVRPEQEAQIPAHMHQLLKQRGIVFNSKAMRRTIADIIQMSQTDDTVLFMGPSGSGKTACAALLHELSPRAAAPFKEFDCSYHAGDHQNFASSLYGIGGKAFSGVDARPSFIEAAGDGSLFLDECTEIPLQAQAVLLGALDSTNPMYRRYGSLEELPVRCRFLLATNRDIEQEVAEGRFKHDLLHRLTVRLAIPALQQRREDIADLLSGINRRYEARYRHRFRFSQEALAYLERQDWPGNVRQLENVFRRAAANSLSDRLSIADFQNAFRASTRQFAVNQERPTQTSRHGAGAGSDSVGSESESHAHLNRTDSSGALQASESFVANHSAVNVEARVAAMIEELMPVVPDGANIRTLLDMFEAGFTRASLRRTGGNVSKAERSLWGFAGNGQLKRQALKHGLDLRDVQKGE